MSAPAQDSGRFIPEWGEPTAGGVKHELTFDVDLMKEPRRPITDSTLGIPITVKARDVAAYDRRLVALGDSLTQGFHHFAIHDTGISWPAMVAARLGLTVGSEENSGFRVPAFDPPGGYPLNLEQLADINHDDLGSIDHILRYMEQVKDNYAPTLNAVMPPQGSAPNDNLAVWGWDIRDLLERTANTELAAMLEPSVKGFFAHVKEELHVMYEELSPQVDHAVNRTGVTVLAETDDSVAGGYQTDKNALQLAADRGLVETLLVWIGSNNVLKAIINFDIKPSVDSDYTDLHKKENFTVWKPAHFAAELLLLEQKVAGMVTADHVLWGTVPHVTIPPLAHGIDTGQYRGRLDENQRYFRYYTRPWIDPQKFNPAEDPYLTGWDAWLIDSVIDAYNQEIVGMVERQRSAGKDWRLVDMCALLDRLAWRRRRQSDESGGEDFDYLPPYDLPDLYEKEHMDTRFLAVDPTDDKKTVGGIIGLDGIHPTTAGYGLVAREFIHEMYAAGVTFPPPPQPKPDGPAFLVDENGIPEPDWAYILKSDTLYTSPPKYLNEALKLLGVVEHDWDMVKGVCRVPSAAQATVPQTEAETVN